MTDRFFKELNKTGCELREYISLKQMSAMRIDTLARAVLFPDSRQMLLDIINIILNNCVQYVIVGNMSNVLFQAPIYNGIIIKTTKMRGYYLAEDKICVDCGCIFAKAAQYAAQNNFGGFESLAGIPGTLGGMLRSNAGAFGKEMADVFLCADMLDVKNGRIIKCSRDGMRFAYRSSAMQEDPLIALSAVLLPIPMQRREIVEKTKEYAAIRRASQPCGKPSLGSVFKRHNGVGAGYYIDRAGLKGLSVGDAQVSPVHAGFIVNNGSATASDVLRLISVIKEGVYTAFGITLEEEIVII